MYTLDCRHVGAAAPQRRGAGGRGLACSTREGSGAAAERRARVPARRSPFSLRAPSRPEPLRLDRGQGFYSRPSRNQKSRRAGEPASPKGQGPKRGGKPPAASAAAGGRPFVLALTRARSTPARCGGHVIRVRMVDLEHGCSPSAESGCAGVRWLGC
jgi:hypothetical protein